jgi:hypothetical protein
MGEVVSFSLQQYSGVFNLRDAAGQPHFLIDGQAVNYWAERYLATEPELRPLQPFASRDIDFKGSREDVQRIARQLERTPSYPSKVEMTALAGVVPFQIGELISNPGTRDIEVRLRPSWFAWLT